MSPTGYFGWQSGVRTTQAAKASALQFCGQHGKNYSVYLSTTLPLPVTEAESAFSSTGNERF